MRAAIPIVKILKFIDEGFGQNYQILSKEKREAVSRMRASTINYLQQLTVQKSSFNKI